MRILQARFKRGNSVMAARWDVRGSAIEGCEFRIADLAFQSNSGPAKQRVANEIEYRCRHHVSSKPVCQRLELDKLTHREDIGPDRKDGVPFRSNRLSSMPWHNRELCLQYACHELRSNRWVRNAVRCLPPNSSRWQRQLASYSCGRSWVDDSK